MSRNETHDPALTSWVESANAPGADFPIQNLPFGIFRRAGTAEALRGGVAIGEHIVDLKAALDSPVFDVDCRKIAALAANTTLNDFMAAGPQAWSALRLALSRELREGSSLEPKLRSCLVAQVDAESALPARLGDYTDFSASIHHTTKVGSAPPS